MPTCYKTPAPPCTPWVKHLYPPISRLETLNQHPSQTQAAHSRNPARQNGMTSSTHTSKHPPSAPGAALKRQLLEHHLTLQQLASSYHHHFTPHLGTCFVDSRSCQGCERLPGCQASSQGISGGPFQQAENMPRGSLQPESLLGSSSRPSFQLESFTRLTFILQS